jgi:hypothetical protein
MRQHSSSSWEERSVSGAQRGTPSLMPEVNTLFCDVYLIFEAQNIANKVLKYQNLEKERLK